MPKQAVLIGAGHAHLQVIRDAAAFRRAGHDLTVVAPEPFWYSGLATGMLGGFYPPERDCIDITALARQGGAHCICERMIGLDRPARKVILERRGALPYDVLSLNLGSAPPVIGGYGGSGATSVKPIARLRDLRSTLEARFQAGERQTRIVIAGGGATAAEIAGNIAALAASHGRASIVLLAGGDALLGQLPSGAAAAVRANLEGRGIELRLKSRVLSLEPGSAVLDGGERVAFDAFVNATGLRPPPLVAQLGLPVDEQGALRVDRYLRSPADPHIHAGGDCAALDGHALPRIGVYAIRQAPVLLNNLLAALAGTPPRPFKPQRRYLWIMNLGDGTGLAMRGRLWWHGRSAFRLKDWIDRRFLDSYRPHS